MAEILSIPSPLGGAFPLGVPNPPVPPPRATVANQSNCRFGTPLPGSYHQCGRTPTKMCRRRRHIIYVVSLINHPPPPPPPPPTFPGTSGDVVGGFDKRYSRLGWLEFEGNSTGAVTQCPGPALRADTGNCHTIKPPGVRAPQGLATLKILILPPPSPEVGNCSTRYRDALRNRKALYHAVTVLVAATLQTVPHKCVLSPGTCR